jgi:crossover junction endodeoxyribonuclease RuvC
VRVLGVDPGLSRCGLAVVDGDAHRAVIVRAGVVRTPPSAPTAERLASLYEETRTLVAETSPDTVAIERVFFNSNVRTAMGVGQAAGVVLLAAAQSGLAVTEYTPTQVKAAVAGRGDADKDQVAFMVRAIFSLADVPKPADVADALALGLCHLRQGAASGPSGGAMSPRLAAAVAEAGPGAQVTRRADR